jgi:uncharacterized protein (DUF1330 family)
MNRFVTMGLAMLGSAALGATAVQTLHAQAKPPAYVIGEINVKDQDGYMKEFAPAAVKAMDAFGGKFLVRGGKPMSIQGAAPAQRMIVVQYESMEKIHEWWNAQATKDAFKMGEKYADLRQIAVEGLAP